MPYAVIEFIPLFQEAGSMPDWHFDVASKDDLNLKIRAEILGLDNIGRGDEIYGTVHVTYSDENVKKATLVPYLEGRGIEFEWKRRE